MNFAAIAPRLPDHLNDKLADAVAVLEAAVAAGAVKNADFVFCKETINWAVDKAWDHYQDQYRDYGHGPLVMGAYHVPSAIKYATNNRPRNYIERLAVLEALLPLHALIQAAKPLVVKRVTGPGALKTALQIEREAATMTCQCCGNRYLANTGTIAHQFAWREVIALLRRALANPPRCSGDRINDVRSGKSLTEKNKSCEQRFESLQLSRPSTEDSQL